MKLSESKTLKNSPYRVIIGDAENIPSSISATDKKLFTAFLKKDDDFTIVNELESSIFLVKSNKDAEKNRVAGAKIRKALNKEVEEVAFLGDKRHAFDLLEGFLLTSYQFLKYFKDEEKREYKLENILVEDSFGDDAIEELFDITTAVFWARDMVNEPVSFLNAEQFAEEITALANDANLEVTVLEKAQIEALKMGGLLSVNKGSIDPPTFSIIEYKPKKAKNKKPIVLVGKGVVYDTGGLSLKPTANSMDIMKSDMGGAATMVGAIYLAAKQELPVHLIALIPATDNRPGLNAYAPGDVITMMNGLTVEVLNTDAEGRMILADALTYSKKFKPELVIDAATLTGAAHRAVGEQATCIMGNAKDTYFEQLEKAGQKCYERTITFPFWEEYGEQMKSPIADLKNIGGPSAGMITAGKFLENFVTSPYIHLDIAGPAWLNKDSAYRTRGGSGVGVRMLYHFFKSYK
ncbi:MAG: leucyl aminopeptidase [Fluviicola sp.]|nr:leucyl aminopeptidase [Fluviicola sp.]